MSKINNFLNTLSILTTLIMLSFCYWARLNLPSYLSSFSYISLFGLAATIFTLPDFLCYYFPTNNKWYRTSEFYTGFLLLFLGICGVIISQLATWIGFIIIPIGIALTIWQFYQFIRDKSFLTLTAGLFFMVLMILLFFSQGYHSLIFPEKIILGKAHIDTLFLSSMSNMFSTLGWASTGLDGSPYIQYHWGSNALFGGLKNWTGLNALMFYNIAYPAIFLPLFFKSFFNFLNRLFAYKGMGSVNILFAVSFLILIYSMRIAGFQAAVPIISESLCIALLFTLLYASNLLFYCSASFKNHNLFFWYSVTIILLISFFKISNGFVCFVGLAYLYLRTYRNIQALIMFLTGGLIITTFIYLFVYPIDRLTYSLPLTERISNAWFFSVGFISYLMGAIIAMFVVLKNKSLDNWSEIKLMIKTREYIDLEVLFIITISGFLAGAYISTAPADVYYFCSTQLFISIPYLILFSQRYFDKFTASEKAKTVFLYLLVIFSVISRPGVGLGFMEIVQEKKDLLTINQHQLVLKGLITDLFKLEKESGKKTICIYIPKTEKWYYESQSFRPMGSPMVVPAITGIALIGSISDSIYRSDFNYYSYYYYKKHGQSQVKDLMEAKESAIKKGYTKLIEYQSIDEKLVKQTFDLKK
jgi:hypothetical protein